MTMTSDNQIETLIRVTSQLIGVLDKEVEFLRAMRVAEIVSLQKEKHDLTVLYEESISLLAAKPEVLEALEPAVRSELSDLASRFDSVLAENARALNAVKDSHDRLLRTIVDAVAEKRSSQKAYTPNGSLDNPQGTRSAQTLSLTVDQRL